jgi:hypothetical protein
MDEADAGRLCLLRQATLHSFDVRVVVLPGGGRLAFDERQWRDCLVEVERGEVELRFGGERKLVCTAGTVLSFVGLPIRALHNPRHECSTLVAVSRRTAPR